MRRPRTAAAQVCRPACHMTFGVSVLDQQPVPLGAPSAGEIEADDDALLREPVPAEHVAHRPERHKGIEVLGGDLGPGGTPLAE